MKKGNNLVKFIMFVLLITIVAISFFVILGTGVVFIKKKILK